MLEVAVQVALALPPPVGQLLSVDILEEPSMSAPGTWRLTIPRSPIDYRLIHSQSHAIAPLYAPGNSSLSYSLKLLLILLCFSFVLQFCALLSLAERRGIFVGAGRTEFLKGSKTGCVETMNHSMWLLAFWCLCNPLPRGLPCGKQGTHREITSLECNLPYTPLVQLRVLFPSFLDGCLRYLACSSLCSRWALPSADVRRAW